LKKICLICLLFLAPLSAKVTKSQLEQFYDSLNANTNVTEAGIYEGQRAGYATGGGITIRSRVAKSQLIGIHLPELKSGCGGINLYSGGLSFINREELVEALKAVGQNSFGYAFGLGLEAVSPMIKNNIMDMYSKALNSAYNELNSCEMAHDLVNGLGKRLNIANKQCVSTLTERGDTESMTTARADCDPGNPNNFGNFPTENIAWQSLMQHDIFRNDKELAQNMMTLTGTFISKMVESDDLDQRLTFIPWPSKAEDGFLQYLLRGGKYTVYECDESKQCLNIRVVEKYIRPRNAWIEKVNQTLLTIQDKVLKDTGELTQEEKNFITRTELPVYRIINVLVAYQGSDMPISTWGLADIIATDLLLMYIKDCIGFIREGAAKYGAQTMYCVEVDRFIEDLKDVEEVIRSYERQNADRFFRKLELVEKIDLIEEKLMSEIRF